jgi:hypothetical protein
MSFMTFDISCRVLLDLFATKYLFALLISLLQVYPKISILSRNTGYSWVLSHFTSNHENRSFAAS